MNGAKGENMVDKKEMKKNIIAQDLLNNISSGQFYFHSFVSELLNMLRLLKHNFVPTKHLL